MISVLQRASHICFEDIILKELYLTNCCKHTFHKKCMNNWLNSVSDENKVCPYCRCPKTTVALEKQIKEEIYFST